MAVERLAFHAEMVALMQDDLTAERAALREAIIDTVSDREDDGTPRWSHEQILTALQPLVAAQHRPPEPQRRPPHLTGRNTFTAARPRRSATTWGRSSTHTMQAIAYWQRPCAAETERCRDVLGRHRRGLRRQRPRKPRVQPCRKICRDRRRVSAALGGDLRHDHRDLAGYVSQAASRAERRPGRRQQAAIFQPGSARKLSKSSG